MSSLETRRKHIIGRIFERVVPDDSCMLRGVPCLLWQGPTSGKPKEGDRNSRGHSYPRMSLNGATVAVHLVVFTHFGGYIPYNRTVDHLCKNRLCVQPLHLALVSHKENCRRRDGKEPRKHTDHASLPASLTAEIRQLMSTYMCQEAA